MSQCWCHHRYRVLSDDWRPDCHHRGSRQRHRGAQHQDLPALRSSLGRLTSLTRSDTRSEARSETSSDASSETKVAGSCCLVLGIFLGVRLPVKHLGLLAAVEVDPGDEVIFPVDPNLGDPLLLHHDVLRGLVVEFPAEITEGHNRVAWDCHQSFSREILDMVRNRR